MFTLPTLKYKKNNEGKLTVPSSYKIIAEEHFCKIKFCNRPYEAKGYCELHYRRNRTHGDPLKILNTERNQRCKIKECFNPAHAKLLCNKHYQRFKKHGTCEIKFPRDRDK